MLSAPSILLVPRLGQLHHDQRQVRLYNKQHSPLALTNGSHSSTTGTYYWHPSSNAAVATCASVSEPAKMPVGSGRWWAHPNMTTICACPILPRDEPKTHARPMQVKLAACGYVVDIITHEEIQAICGLRWHWRETAGAAQRQTATSTGPVPEPAVPPQARHAPHRPRYELRYPHRSQITQDTQAADRHKIYHKCVKQSPTGLLFGSNVGVRRNDV
jgi:hypothetical protein